MGRTTRDPEYYTASNVLLEVIRINGSVGRPEKGKHHHHAAMMM
jgi:hypothetical protein